MRHKLTPVLWIAVLLLVAACSPGGDTPSAAQNSSAPSLSETLSVDDEASGTTLTVSYPSGWVSMSEAGFIALANNQATLDALTSTEGPAGPGAGQSLVQVIQLPDFMLGDSPNLESVLQIATGDLAADGGSVSENSAFTAGEGSGLKAAVTSAEGSGFVYAVQFGETYFMVVAVSDNPSGLEATSDAIAASLRVSASGG